MKLSSRLMASLQRLERGERGVLSDEERRAVFDVEPKEYPSEIENHESRLAAAIALAVVRELKKEG